MESLPALGRTIYELPRRVGQEAVGAEIILGHAIF
jgi:hypothetical protein